MRQADRRIDWQHDDTDPCCASCAPPTACPACRTNSSACLASSSTPMPKPAGRRCAQPGQVVARRQHAVLRATATAAVWIGHVRRSDQADPSSCPVSLAFAGGRQPAGLAPAAGRTGCRRLARHPLRSAASVGVLHFPFYNGAMGTRPVRAAHEALRWALAQPTRVLLLLGGTDFWSNGIHLNLIEAADSPADESWRNINAIDDLTQTLIQATGQLVMAAMQGNAGAGGVFMALAADEVWAHPAWCSTRTTRTWATCTAPSTGPTCCRAGCAPAPAVAAGDGPPPADVGGAGAPNWAWWTRSSATRRRLCAAGLARAQALAADPDLPLRDCRPNRPSGRPTKPAAPGRLPHDELARMRRNFYGFDPSYHIARSNFVRACRRRGHRATWPHIATASCRRGRRVRKLIRIKVVECPLAKSRRA
jgi:putative two-component system hydrogenase maturation factor HypX/HoxX